MRKLGATLSLQLFTSISLVFLSSCAPKPDEDSSSENGRFLYVSSGLCQAGGNTTFTATTSSNITYRINLANGQRDRVLVDYNAPGTTGETPVGIVPFDSGNILTLVERSGSRRLEKVKRAGDSDRTNFSTDTAAFANTLLSVKPTSDNALFVSRTNAVTKISLSGATVLTTFLTNAPGGACGTNTKYSDIVSTNKAHLVFANSATGAARVGIVSNTGNSSCLAGINAPAATALPSALAWIPEASQLLVAYAGNAVTTDVNSIYVYDITETATTATIGAGTKIYDASEYPGTKNYLLYAISAMTYDASTKSLYISSATTTATTVVQYVIEKFRYDASGKTITRAGSTPFYNYGLDTKCISSLYVD